MTSLQDFLAGLQPPQPGEQYATPRVPATRETVSEWLRTLNGARTYHPPSKIRAADLLAFERAVNIRPQTYEIEWHRYGGTALSLRPAGTRRATDNYNAFLAALRPAPPGQRYATPGIPPTHVTVSQWLTVDGTRPHRRPSRILDDDLAEFVRAHNLHPDYRTRRDKARNVEGVGLVDRATGDIVRTGGGRHTTQGQWQATIDHTSLTSDVHTHDAAVRAATVEARRVVRGRLASGSRRLSTVDLRTRAIIAPPGA